jgi:phenylpyruvate tautomerase PptA (4-oxalocrotonate tautomerase family)
MPLMIIKTSAPFSKKKAEEILKAATKVLVDVGRKESHAMVLLQKVEGAMGGKPGSVAFAEFRSMVGLTHEFNHKITEQLTPVLENMLGIPGHNIYINFTTVPETAWGWEGGIVTWSHPQKKWIIE